MIVISGSIAYLWRWWNEQTEATKNILRELVRTGRFEFINGGWCMVRTNLNEMK